MVRLLLALAVVAAHMPYRWQVFPSSDTAVEMFFMISGFYIAMILDHVYRHEHVRFYLNRGLRLYPMYGVVWLASVGLWAILSPHRLAVYDEIQVLASQLSLMGLDVFAFTRGLEAMATLSPVPQAWTLSLEIYFYLLAPWLVRWPSRALGVLVALLLLARLVAAGGWGLASDPWSYRFFPFELPLFLLGILAYRRFKNGSPTLPLWGIATYITLLFISPLVASGYPWTVKIFLLILGWALLPGLFTSTRTNATDKTWGELSYPLYISHLLVLAGLSKVWGGEMWPLWLAVAGMGACVAFAWLLDITVGRKLVDHWRDAVRPRNITV